jgi:hypothetical protein
MNTKTKLTERTIVMIVVLMLICLICCLGIRVQSVIWDNGIQRVANRVHVAPTVNGLAEYITAEIQVGMPRDKVEQVFQEMAPIEVKLLYPLEDVNTGYGPTSCDEIGLKITSFPWHIWRIRACYDTQDTLVMLFSDEDGFPTLDIYK